MHRVHNAGWNRWKAYGVPVRITVPYTLNSDSYKNISADKRKCIETQFNRRMELFCMQKEFSSAVFEKVDLTKEPIVSTDEVLTSYLQALQQWQTIQQENQLSCGAHQTGQP